MKTKPVGLRIIVPMMRDTVPSRSVINIVNRTLNKDRVAFGNCDWGEVEFLCTEKQMVEFMDALREAGREDFAVFAVRMTYLDKWPQLPVNVSGHMLVGDTTVDYKTLYEEAAAKLRQIKDAVRKA
jgi:hypothetical protein